MSSHIGAFALVVDDYDRAIAYYTGMLGFELREDSPRENGKRWVLVVPPDRGVCPWGAAVEGAGRGSEPTGMVGCVIPLARGRSRKDRRAAVRAKLR